MKKWSMKTYISEVLLMFVVIIATALYFQFGNIQTVMGQCDPATGCLTDTPGPTCGLPGLPACEEDPPANTPTKVVTPTKTPTRTATATATLTVTPSPTLTSVATRPPLPTSTPIKNSFPTVPPTSVPTVLPTVKPTPKQGLIPQLVLKLPQPPPFLIALAPRPNFEAFNVEITQAIQCLSNQNCPDNSIKLFIGKPTMVRLYVRMSPDSPWFSVSGVGGELCPGIHGIEGCNNPVHSLNYVTVTKLKSTADIGYLRGNIDSTLNFILPQGWTYGNFTVYVNMKGEDYILEATLKDNFITQAFQEYPSNQMDVMFVPVNSRGFLASLSERWRIHDWLVLSYPTSDIRIWEMSGYINNTPDTYDWNDSSGGCGDGWGDLLNDLDWYKGNNPQIFYGMVHYASLNNTPYAGCGRFTSKVAGGWVDTGNRNGPEVAAQEIGHTLHRNHAPGCSAGNPDSNYPTSSGTLDEYGVDVIRNQVYIPYLSFDYMGYCGSEKDTWTSMFTYNNISNLLPQGVFIPGNQKPAMALKHGSSSLSSIMPISYNKPSSGLSLMVQDKGQSSNEFAIVSSNPLYLVGSGSISPQEVILKRGFFLLGKDSASPVASETGPYLFELLDSQGNVLSTLSFAPTEESNETPGDVGAFHLVIPWVENARGYQFKYNGLVIARMLANDLLPSVKNITSSGGNHWPSKGTVTISWEPFYAGSNPLQYLVQYSRDNGATWSMLTLNEGQASLDVDSTLVAGSKQALLRVYVSDGFNTGETVSKAFSVDDKAPDVHIGWTEDNSQVLSGYPVFLIGAATDAQDGPITRSDLHWSIDDNPFAEGDTLVVSTLGVGDHLITLSATNAEGMVGTTSIHLTILPPAPKPQNTSEMSFSWRLLLWAILISGTLLLVLGFFFILRKSRRRTK